MNKLFTKIAALALGATMAVGVGVAVASSGKEATPVKAVSYAWQKVTSTSEFVDGTMLLITQGSYYLDASQAATGNTPRQASLTLSNGLPTLTANNTCTLTVSGSGSSIKLVKSTDTTKYLYTNTSNNGARISNQSTNGQYWTISSAGTNEFYLASNASTTRYLSRYSTTDFRSYTNTNTNANLVLYKLVETASYTISYNNNGGSGTMTSTTGSDPAVASCTFTAPTGKHFDHWNTSATDNGTTYAVGATPKATLTLYAIWATNSYTVGGTITNGSLSSTANVSHGSALSITINPSSGHKLPTTLTSVTMGGSAYAGYTYNSGTGAFSIASVTGNVVINATCPVDATTYTISGSITNGSLSGDTGEQVEGDDYTVQITPTALYKYPTSVTVTGAGEEDSGWEYDSSDGIVYIYGLGGNVTISATCPAASITSITVSGQKTTFTLGEDFSFGGTVKASYDDVAGSTNVTISTDLVNIDSSAYNAFTESNSYTISVALKSNGSVSTSYTVSVTRKSISTTTTYVKVSASQSDWSGKYVFMNANNGYVMGTTITSDRVTNGTLSDIKNSSGNTIGASDTVIASGYTSYVYTITKVGDYYTISPDTGTNAGKFLSSTGVKNKAQFLESSDTSDYRLWTITYSSGFVITNKYNAAQSVNAVLRCNDTNGWAPYGPTQATNGAPCLFAKTETPTGTKSLIRITAVGPADNEKKEDDILTAADFTVTALYDTAESGTVTQNVSVTSGATLVAGSNTVTLSYTEGGVTKTCQVTVVAAENTANLDGIVWSQEGVSRTIFEGSAIGSFGTLEKHYDDESTIALNLNECTVAVYNNTSGSKAHDVADPSTYTWNITNDNGKYLGVTYDEYTLYSGVVNVVETINAVYGKVEQMTFTTKASATNPIAVGDTVVFAYDDASMEMVGNTGSIGQAGSFTTNPAGTYALTVEEGSEEGSFAFKNGTDYVAYTKDEGTTSNNNLHKVSEVNDTSSWTVSYDGDVVSLVNVHNTEREIHYNTSSGQERFCAYLSTNSFPCIQVYKGATTWVPSGSNIANTNAVVQKAVLEYAEHFNDTMNCVNGGTTANVSGKWSTLSGDFDDLLDSFSGENLAHCKALFAGADAVEEGDTLQDMLARYEYICAKYKLDDFLADIDRPPVAQRATISPLSIVGSSGNTVAIIVVISMISVTAIGGYFFLRKRKEEI